MLRQSLQALNDEPAVKVAVGKAIYPHEPHKMPKARESLWPCPNGCASVVPTETIQVAGPRELRCACPVCATTQHVPAPLFYTLNWAYGTGGVNIARVEQSMQGL